MYTLAFHTFIGNAFGGTPFSSNPVVAVVDRGNNTITTQSTGTITASIMTSLATSVNNTKAEIVVLYPVSMCKVNIINGLAEFKGLYINEARVSYQLIFTADLVRIIFPANHIKFLLNSMTFIFSYQRI